MLEVKEKEKKKGAAVQHDTKKASLLVMTRKETFNYKYQNVVKTVEIKVPLTIHDLHLREDLKFVDVPVVLNRRKIMEESSSKSTTASSSAAIFLQKPTRQVRRGSGSAAPTTVTSRMKNMDPKLRELKRLFK